MTKNQSPTDPEARVAAIILAILLASLAITVGVLWLTGQLPSNSFHPNPI